MQVASRYAVLATLLIFSAAAVEAQSGGGIEVTGTGGRHSITGRLIFPSGQRADTRLAVRLESPGQGDSTVLSDSNGNFSFRSLKAGNYTVVVDGGDYFETVRESVFIDTPVTGPRMLGVIPVSRPFTVQIYLQAKGGTARARPGVLNASLANVPKPALELYDRAMEAVGRNETDKAIDQLKQAVALYPNFGLALNELGLLYLKGGQLDDAAAALTKVIHLSPEAAEPSLNYGIVLLQQKRFEDAQKQLRDAVKKNDHAFTGHLYLGITLIHFRSYGEAETELRRAVTLGGVKAGQAHYYLGGLYWQTGSFQQAADELELYLKLEPKAANAEKVRGTIRDLRAKS